jgi:hypothetical protein
VKLSTALPLTALALGGCATPAARLHSQTELATVARGCAVPLGNVVQFEEEPRLVFLMEVERPQQLVCVRQWAQRRKLRLVYMERAEPAE